MGVTVSLAQKSPIPDKPGGSLKKTWMTRGKLVCLEGPVITCTISQKAENCRLPLAYLTPCDLLLRAGMV